MKRFNSFFICVAALGLVAGCGDKSGSSAQGTNTVNVATNGFGGYVKSMGEAQKTADKTVDTSALNQAIQLFNVQEGRYPKDLQELVPNYVAKIPEVPYGYKIVYDATTATVKVVQQP